MTKNQRWAVAAVLIVAAALRIFLQIQNETGNPLAATPEVDAAIHHANAMAIAEEGLVRDRPFDRPPLYAYFVAALYRLIGPSPVVVAFLQMVLGMAGLFMVYRLARLAGSSHGPALLAVGLTAFYGPLAFFELKLLPASLSVFLVLLFLNLLAPYLKEGRIRYALAAGLAGGLLVLDRPNLAFLLILVFLWLLIRPPRGARMGAAALALGVAAGIAPAFLHNLAAGDGSVPICAGGGLNFYLGNREGGEVSFTQPFPGMTDPAAMPEMAAMIYEAETGKPPANQAAIEWFWTTKALREIVGAPGPWLRLQLKKVLALLSEFEYGINYSYGAEKHVLPLLSWFFVPFWLLAGLGLAGAFMKVANRESEAALHRIPLLLVLAAVLLSTLVFFTYSRFRLAGVPVLAILGAQAFFQIMADMKAGRKKHAFLQISMALFIAVMSIIPAGLEAREQLGSGHALVGQAYYMNREGAEDAEAIEKASAAYERAAALNTDPVPALVTLAGIKAATGNYKGAWKIYKQSLLMAPENPAVLCHVANFLTTAPAPYKNLGRAEALCRQAEFQYPDFALASLNLGIALHYQGKEEESEKAFEEMKRKSGGDPSLLHILAGWYRNEGLLDKAEALEKELRLDPHH